jgi:hypothetical protein
LHRGKWMELAPTVVGTLLRGLEEAGKNR